MSFFEKCLLGNNIETDTKLLKWKIRYLLNNTTLNVYSTFYPYSFCLPLHTLALNLALNCILLYFSVIFNF